MSDNEDERISLSEHDDDKENSGNEDGEARRIDPTTSTKKVIRRPQPKLNAERLKGPKGIQTIEKYFDGFKFHGKGHEKNDLDRIMKRLEHWGHRLFPKYEFDDFLEKMEVLGTKKEVQVYLTKYRKDMLTDDVIEENEINDDEREKTPEPFDEFDAMIAEQIEKAKQATSQRKDTPKAPKNNNEEFRKEMERKLQNALEKKMEKRREKEIEKNQTISENIRDFDQSIIETIEKTTPIVNNEKDSDKNKEISEEEIKKRIERNRQIALERKMARIRQKEMAKNNENSKSISQNIQTTVENVDQVVEDKNEKIEKTKKSPADEKSSSENNFAAPKTSDVSSENKKNVNSTKRLLTDEELDREIGAAVDMFMKKKRESL